MDTGKQFSTRQFEPKCCASDGSDEILLFDRERVVMNTLSRTFTLRLPIDYDPNREWSLKVIDLEEGDEGILRSWSLELSSL